MILGIDHIQFSVAYPEKVERFLQPAGFELAFQGQVVFEDYQQAGALYFEKPDHISFLTRHDCSLELLSTTQSEVSNKFKLVFKGTPSNEQLALNFQGVEGNIEQEIDVLISYSSNQENSRRLWTALGFEEYSKGGATRFIRKPSVFSKGLSLEIKEAKDQDVKKQSSKIDSLGASLLSFQVTNLEKEISKLRSHCLSVTGPLGVTVNNKSLRVAFFHALSGEVVEFVEMRAA